MSPFKIKVMIKKWINKYFKKKEENIYSKTLLTKTLLRIDNNKLFRGHNGSIWTYGNTLYINNNYFNSMSTQSIDTKTGIVNVQIQTTVDRRKWVCKLLSRLEQQLGQDVELKLVQGNYEYTIGYMTHVLYKKDTDLTHILTHTDIISKIKEMSKNISQLLKNLKHCEYDQLLTMPQDFNSSKIIINVDTKLLA
jgi:hypothetical protein